MADGGTDGGTDDGTDDGTDMEVVYGGKEWVLNDLHYGERASDEMPNKDTCLRLLTEYHTAWCMRDVTPQTLIPRIFELLRIEPDRQNVGWKCMHDRLKLDFMRWIKLDKWTRKHEIDSTGDVKQKLLEIHRSLQTTARFLVLNNTMCVHMRDGDSDPLNAGLIPPAPADLPLLHLNLHTNQAALVESGEEKNTLWQESFFKLRVVLAGEDFRRAGKLFFGRCVTASSLETQAFKPAMKIVDFIEENTRYDTNLDGWRVHTADASAHSRMIEYFTERPLAEAPDIEENCHLRSYEGDAYGRGAVIYDCAADMAWPYARKADWGAMEERVNDIRKLVHGKEFVRERHGVVAPAPEDVCVVHLNTTFPYDIFAETEELVADDNYSCFLQRAWYDTEHFENRDAGYRLGDDYRVAAYMQGAFAPVDADDEPTVWGRTWQRACASPDKNMRELRLRNARAVDAIVSMDCYPLSDAFLYANVLFDDDDNEEHITEHHYVQTPSGDVWVPLCSPSRKRRHRLDMATWTALGKQEARLHRRTFVVVRPYPGQRWTEVAAAPEGFDLLSVPDEVATTLYANRHAGETCLPEHLAATLALVDTAYVRVFDVLFVPVPVDVDAMARTRYLRVHTGRTWRDCATPQFDKIYDSQSFVPHDKFMLWGQKGRTLFMVHEFDTYQLTFIIIGYGGTGKSTIMTVMQKWWPAHLRGILSSNIEQKFGMSQVLNEGKTRAIFCNEVSEDLQLVQEDWQTSCSGEEGSYAVKNKDAWVGVCKAHQFWCGNGFPKHWKNDNMQVSRRLCGVVMDTPIQPRDGGVMGEIEKIMGVVQRKMVLAYFGNVDQYGTTDPMSSPDTLPPAFHYFYFYGRGISNPVETFLDESIGAKKLEIWLGCHPTWKTPLVMTTATFRDLYMAWRGTRTDLSRIPSVSRDKYIHPLRERGVIEHITQNIRNTDGTLTVDNVLVGIGECGVPPLEIVFGGGN